MSLASEVLAKCAQIMLVVELLSGLHGRFKVTLDGAELAFSKAALKRPPAPTDAVGPRLRVEVGSPLEWRGTGS
jgi:hypothetical protein